MGNNIRVECIAAGDDIDLENEINEWILENDVEIIDIKFSSSSCVENEKVYYDYSALIIYKIEK